MQIEQLILGRTKTSSIVVSIYVVKTLYSLQANIVTIIHIFQRSVKNELLFRVKDAAPDLPPKKFLEVGQIRFGFKFHVAGSIYSVKRDFNFFGLVS